MRHMHWVALDVHMSLLLLGKRILRFSQAEVFCLFFSFIALEHSVETRGELASLPARVVSARRDRDH